MFNAGKLNKRISFIRKTDGTAKDTAGDTIIGTDTFATVWARVDYVKGREYFEAKKFQSELTYRITVRYMQGITPDMVISYNNRTFKIEDIMDPLEYHEVLEIMCFEKVYKIV